MPAQWLLLLLLPGWQPAAPAALIANHCGTWLFDSDA
jgi:hypothetical protein